MNPQQFHERFSRGRNKITEILDNPNAGELSPDEKIKVDAIKNRINYYGAKYAKERANAKMAQTMEAVTYDNPIIMSPTQSKKKASKHTRTLNIVEAERQMGVSRRT